MTVGICQGRVFIVTGAGRGIGREHALELARQGARVVVNDWGGALDGQGASSLPAEDVVREISGSGGDAIANGEDVTSWEGAGRMVQMALDQLWRLDGVINNAGFFMDRMFVSTSEQEWDDVLSVHLKGHFCVSRHAATFWREEAKKGRTPDARIVNTSSGAGLLGSVGQGAYSTAKAGIAALTLVQAAELGRYGVTANAIAPAARTRMTEQAFATMMAPPEQGFDAMDPRNISPLVAWLASSDSSDITGRVFEVQGGMIAVAEGWQRGPTVDRGGRWEPAAVGRVVRGLLLAARQPGKVYGT